MDLVSQLTRNSRNKKNGNIHRYVYYGCTKSRDKHCKSGYISEEELTSQLEKLIDQMEFSETGIKTKIKYEVERFKKFQQYVLGSKEKITVGEVDIRAYMKYLLKEGSNSERRELLSHLKTRLALANKVVQFSFE